METFLRLQRMSDEPRHAEARIIRLYCGSVHARISQRGRIEQKGSKLCKDIPGNPWAKRLSKSFS